MTDADVAERQAKAMERLADEMERQNAVLTEVARAVHVVAMQTSPVTEYRQWDAPTPKALFNNVDDHEVTREMEERR